MALTAIIALVSPAASSWAADNDEAAQQFLIYCSKCHGADGHGDGPDSATLKTKPRNFTDCARMSKISDDVIFHAIKDGGASVNLSADMPSWTKAFEDSEIQGLVKYVHGLKG